LIACTLRSLSVVPEAIGEVVDLASNLLTEPTALFDALPTAVPSLTILRLSRNRLAPPAFAGASTASLQKALASLTSLHTLDLSHNPLNDEVITSLFSGLQAPTVKFLHLNNVGVTDKGLEAIAASLAAGATPMLAELKLNSNSMGDAGLAALAFALAPTSPAVKSLRTIELLSCQNIKFQLPGCCAGAPPGLKALRVAVKANRALTVHLPA